MPIVIAVSNQKGGVAKTTTALTVSAHFAAQGRSVLALDLDPQGNLTLGLGLRPKVGEVTMTEVLLEQRPLAAAARLTAHAALPKLAVAPATRSLARAERELPGEVGFDSVLQERIAETSAYDIIVLDCPPALGVLTMNALVAADLVLVPVQCEYFSAIGLGALLDLVKVVRKRRNPALKVKLLPTLFDRRNGICKGILAELRKNFQAELASVVIDVDTRLREAAAKGRPISLYAPRSRANKQYETLAKELLAHAPS